MSSYRIRQTLSILATATFGLTPLLARAEEAPPTPTPVAEPTPIPTPEPPKPEVKKESWTDRVTIGGRVWLSYLADFTEGKDDFNTFDVTRTYLQAKAKLSDGFKLALTLDAPKRDVDVKGATADDTGAITLSRSTGAYEVLIKHAFGELTDVGTKGLYLRLGMQGLPWVPYEENLYGYRYQGTILADREGYWSSTDLGLSIGYDLPSKYFSLVVMAANGEKWSAPEVSSHKDVHAMVTIRPLPDHAALGGLSLTGAFSFGSYDKGDDMGRSRFLGQLAFAQPHGALSFSYLSTSDPAAKMKSAHPSLGSSTDAMVSGGGFSAWGWLDLGAFGVAEGFRLLARLDSWDPDTNLDDNGHMREIFGFSYRFNKYVEALIDLELTQNEDASGMGEDEFKLGLHTDWKF